MTQPSTLLSSPPVVCPPWCDGKQASDWEQLFETGQLVRSHDIGSAVNMPPSAGYETASASGYAEEYADGTPTKFGVNITAPGVSLTPEQAIEWAQQLTSLAQRVQYVRHQVEFPEAATR